MIYLMFCVTNVLIIRCREFGISFCGISFCGTSFCGTSFCGTSFCGTFSMVDGDDFHLILCLPTSHAKMKSDK